MNKQQYIEMCNKDFAEMKASGMTLEQMVRDYFNRYTYFGTSTECKISKITKETGFTKEEVQSLVGTVLVSKHKGYVQIKS